MTSNELESKITDILTNTSEYDSLASDHPDYMLYSPHPVGYNTISEQNHLFLHVLSGFNPNQSILDIGCGRADMAHFISEFYGKLNAYTGIDHNPIMADLAKQKYDYNVIVGAYETTELNQHDWVVASGLFTQRRCETEEQDFNKLLDDIELMYNAANSAVSFNLLSPINTQHHEGFFYVHPGLMLDMLIDRYGYVSVKNNYSQDVYTITIYKF